MIGNCQVEVGARTNSHYANKQDIEIAGAVDAPAIFGLLEALMLRWL